MIDSKGMDSEGMEGKHKKIFGSKLESFDFKGSTLYVRNGFRWKIFGSKLESVDFKSVDFKWFIIYVRNGFRWKIFGLKLGYLLIGKWCDYPPPEGCFLIVYVYDTIYGVDTLCYIYYCVNMIRLLRVLFVRYWTYIGVFIYVQFTVCARGF